MDLNYLMSKLDELKTLLKKYNLWAKKRLGQNFLVDEKVFDRIIEASDLKPSDNVIEVGPGTGFLTERLIEKVGHVTAVEKDADMIRILKKKFAFGSEAQARRENYENLKIIQSDILKFNPCRRAIDCAPSGDGYKVIANIPYYITSPLLKHFLQSDNCPNLMVLLVQKEVAEKICGLSGKSLITIETQLFGKPEIIATVPSSAFYPAPKVESAILRIDVFKKPLVPKKQLSDFLRVVKFGFSQKRKKLNNSLAAGLHIKPSEMADLLKQADIDPDLRAEHLGIEEWKRLATLSRVELIDKG